VTDGDLLTCSVAECTQPALARVFPTHGDTDHKAWRCRECLLHDLEDHWFRKWRKEIYSLDEYKNQTDHDDALVNQRVVHAPALAPIMGPILDELPAIDGYFGRTCKFAYCRVCDAEAEFVVSKPGNTVPLCPEHAGTECCTDGGRDINQFDIAEDRPAISYGPHATRDDQWVLAATTGTVRVELLLEERAMYDLWTEVKGVPWPDRDGSEKDRLVRQVVHAANGADEAMLRDALAVLGHPDHRDREVRDAE